MWLALSITYPVRNITLTKAVGEYDRRRHITASPGGYRIVVGWVNHKLKL